MNGFCTQGCLPGYTGGRCDAIKDEIILEREEGEMKSSSALLLSVFIALWFLGILGATCIPKYQKQKMLPQRETDGLNTKIHSTPVDENLKVKSNIEVEKSHSEELNRDETAEQNKTLEYQKSQSFHQTLLEVFEINSTALLK